MGVYASVVVALCAAGCASAPAGRTGGEARRGIEASRERSPHFPMLTDEEVRKSIPGMFDRRRIPNLVRVGALLPGTMRAELVAWGAMQREGTLDPQLLQEVFWVVSRSNDCFY